MGTNNWINRNWQVILLMIIPVLLTLIVWNKLPEQMPVHWNLKGEVDGYESKFIGVLIIPITMLVTNIIFWIIPFVDPKKNVASFQDTLTRIQVAINIFFCGLGLILLGSALGLPLKVHTLIIYGVLFLLGVLGNYFGKIRPNHFVGIRTPWTLENETVWVKTHRYAGKIWVACTSIMMLMKSVMPMEPFWYVFALGILIMVGVPAVYSYRLFKELEGDEISGSEVN